jgi:hypothetical protein
MLLGFPHGNADQKAAAKPLESACIASQFKSDECRQEAGA